MKTKKIHGALKLNQSHWLKPFIEFNTKKIIEAGKNNGKDGKALYELLNYAIYRKTMENIRNRIDVKLVNNEKDYLKCISKPSYMSHKTFDNTLVAIQKSKLALKLNKPAYTEMCILELSKVLMYQFHYDYIKNEYENKSKLLFKDTESLMYEYNEYNDVLLNNKCIRHSMNRIQSKDHRIGTYVMNKISLPCFDDKIYIQNNGYDGLVILIFT